MVQPGESLYTIAWRYRLDYQDLARWNDLENPDLIYVGQRLSLRAAGATRPAQASSSAPQPRPLPPAPNLAPPTWQWPAQGELVRAFGADSGLGNGIGIGGSVGQAIRAAAAGRVVYSGSGLIGYGQLLIIKHNDTYLSAYGHNNRLIVGQGDSVERGQTIAEMGIGPERQPQLHFEIRRNGSPVDPLDHLPR
ncbi:MAG: peptidoglycan DD-metalloendopeptidase family protein [Gammaproteobacteria bacterium]|nr:peptidoglycan DD-metalloendopeptidase family protein [Gammaproteobacteria bacterium]MCZ6585667.1 peptidoglycan DD-metalloendopeptidase family protein [Gammaproteobacteria bacterium]